MSEWTGGILVGPSSEHGGLRQVGVLGERLGEAVWRLVTVPPSTGDLTSTFRLTAGPGVDQADVVRVGTALALYSDPVIGEVGGTLLSHLGRDAAEDLTVTADLAALALPIDEVPLAAVVTGGPDLAPLAGALAVGRWSVGFAALAAHTPW